MKAKRPFPLSYFLYNSILYRRIVMESFADTPWKEEITPTETNHTDR